MLSELLNSARELLIFDNMRGSAARAGPPPAPPCLGRPALLQLLHCCLPGLTSSPGRRPALRPTLELQPVQLVGEVAPVVLLRLPLRHHQPAERLGTGELRLRPAPRPARPPRRLSARISSNQADSSCYIFTTNNKLLSLFIQEVLGFVNLCCYGWTAPAVRASRTFLAFVLALGDTPSVSIALVT